MHNWRHLHTVRVQELALVLAGLILEQAVCRSTLWRHLTPDTLLASRWWSISSL